MQFKTSLWSVRGHTLASEQGKPAIEWINYTDHYEGDSEEDCCKTVWETINDTERKEPYVLFIYRYGDLSKRVDIC